MWSNNGPVVPSPQQGRILFVDLERHTVILDVEDFRTMVGDESAELFGGHLQRDHRDEGPLEQPFAGRPDKPT